MNSLGKGQRNVTCVMQDKARQTFEGNNTNRQRNFVGCAFFVASASDRMKTASKRREGPYNLRSTGSLSSARTPNTHS